MLAFSTTVTSFPSWASWIAADKPAPPAPTTTTSVSTGVLKSSSTSFASKLSASTPAVRSASSTADKKAADDIVAPVALSTSVEFLAMTSSFTLSIPCEPTDTVSFSSVSMSVITPLSRVTFTFISPPYPAAFPSYVPETPLISLALDGCSVLTSSFFSSFVSVGFDPQEVRAIASANPVNKFLAFIFPPLYQSF